MTFREKFDLSPAGLRYLWFAIGAMVFASVALAGVSEDVLAKNGLETTDPQHLATIIHHRSAWLVRTARDVTTFGSVGFLVVLGVLVLVVLWISGARLAVAAAPLLSLLATGAIVSIVKSAVNRSRPPVGLRLAVETEPSFPSGHASDSTALFVATAIIIAAIVLRKPLARVAVVAIGFLASAVMGITRLVLGIHWPTDVLAGWALGTLIGCGVACLALLVIRFIPLERSDPGRFVSARDSFLSLCNLQRPAH